MGGVSMRNHNLLRLILIVIISISIAVSCAMEKQESDNTEIMSGEVAKERPATVTKSSLKDEESMIGGKKGSDMRKKRGLDQPFFRSFSKAKTRLLEYHVNLTFDCKKILKSRKALLSIIEKYGYLRGSHATTEYDQSYMTADLCVKADSLYEMLIDLEAVGILLSERITVTDHTEAMIWNQMKIEREQLRIVRKNRAINRVSPKATNWRDREASLERSEDQLDQSKYEEWKIEDKVKWAKIHIYLKGPSKPFKVSIPKYQEALIGVVNILLFILYILVWLSPFIILFFVIWFNRKKIASVFKGNTSKKRK